MWIRAGPNREKIPEEDARQALEYFEAAKQSNQADDFKAACSYFETSFLLNPKLTTLISTANMHLKLRNPTVASEIYMRLLQNPSVPQRERGGGVEEAGDVRDDEWRGRSVVACDACDAAKLLWKNWPSERASSAAAAQDPMHTVREIPLLALFVVSLMRVVPRLPFSVTPSAHLSRSRSAAQTGTRAFSRTRPGC